MNTARPYGANRLKKIYTSGGTGYGTYVSFAGTRAVEVAGIAGFDFVRIDQYGAPYSLEALESRVLATLAHGMTPWVRVRNDAYDVMTALNFGAQALTIPNVATMADAQAAVEAARFPPAGDREMGRPVSSQVIPAEEYVLTANADIILGVQIESPEGVENCGAIAQVDGIDVIHSGRGDLSLGMGYPGQPLHPAVLEAERHIIETALAAGKQVSVLEPANEAGLKRVRQWCDAGVRIITIDSDYSVLMAAYQAALRQASQA